ncbi:hypothetical protein GCM10009547_11730 [Sporichthya brevicatena]|uniref:Copper transport protein n=1 Tax=Sporichthya brevicatena TaxID=171442 RepID=A0ABN1GH30_9ACTN
MRPAPLGAGGRRNRRLAALLLFLLTWFSIGVGAAGPAAAHAELASSSPASGAALDTAPEELTLRFTESITQVPGAMKLIAADGTEAPLGRTVVEGNTLRVPVPGPLPDAGYVFVYRVISADSHPIAGAITFTLGETATAASADRVAEAVGGGGDSVVSALAGVNRWAGYAGVILLLGVPAFVVLCRRESASDPVLRGLTATGGGLILLTTLASLPLQSARSVGGGLADGFDEIDTVLDTTYGEAALARLALLVVAGAGLLLARRSPVALAVAGLAGFGVLLTYARSGHPAVGEYPWATTTLDAVHFGAVALWVGGLLVLAVHLLPRPPADCAAVLARWSPVAMNAVGVLAVAGSIQAWRELRSVEALYDTEYGRWVLAKAAGLVLLLLAAEYGRRRVRAMAAAAPAPLVSASLGAALAERPDADVRTLRRSVALELGLAGAVLAATSALVVTTPGGGHAEHGEDHFTNHVVGAHGDHDPAGHGAQGSESPVAGPVSASIELPNDVRVEVVADPARAGSAVLTLTVRSLDGELVDPPEVNVTAALPSGGIAPITLSPVRAEPGRFTVDATPMLLAGTWKITVTVRTTETDAGVGSVEIPLAPA